ncbi:MAG: DUF1552 domain-containing protein [Sandaracinaceae bacterium]
MTDTTKSIPRRAFLRGLGTAIALPALEAMIPRGARADAAPLRVLYYYVPNGVYVPAWTPSGVGNAWSPSPTLAPLATWGLTNDVTVVTGLRNDPVNIQDNGAHFRGTAGLLSARTIVKEHIQNGISADQVAAQAIGGETIFRSLQVGLAAGGAGTGLCGAQWPCAYLTNISWSSDTTPMGKEISPRAVFDRLFAGQGQQASQDARDRRRALDLSVLDFVRGDATRLMARLGRTDRARMDEYLTEVRELERRIMGSSSGDMCDAGDPPPGGTLQERLEQMQDLMVLAFRCDLTRIATFMTLNAGASDYNTVYSWLTATQAPDGSPITPIPVTEPKHANSHHQELVERVAQLQAIATWEVERFGRLVSALKNTPEGTGTLLDNCLVVFTSEYGDPNSHTAIDMPCIVAGSGCGQLPPRGHVPAPGAKWSNFLRSMLAFQGVTVAELGDSDGMLF